MARRSAFRPNLNKYLLKRTLKGALPNDVLYGRKYGFGYNIGLQALLASAWRPVIDAFVRHGRYLELGLFSRRGAEWAIGHAPADAWRLLVFAIWAEIYLFGESTEALAGRITGAVPISSKPLVA